MPKKYGKKKYKQHYALYTVATAILLCAIFLTMVAQLYSTAEEDAYENLHVQTKQIKDDITLQLISDRENLSTIANFASKLYRDGEGYDLMFESFKPIGLIENIGILNPDNTFVTKAGFVDLDGLISFEDEKQKGAYISGRVEDLTRPGNEIIRSAVPVVANGETVGILYGVIKLDKIGNRYNQMARELDAQLFVYSKDTGNLVIDTVHKELGNISFLKDRKYNDDYSFEEMMSTDKGFVSFVSAYRDENLHIHYSAIEDLDWMICVGRYDSQVFVRTHLLFNALLVSFLAMLFVIVVYVLMLMASERRVNRVTAVASDTRKILLETSGNNNKFTEALKQVCMLANAKSALFFNSDGDVYSHIIPSLDADLLDDNEKKYFMSELLRYASEFHKSTGTAVNIMSIKPNRHLERTNPAFYDFFKKYKITDVSFSATINNANYITVLAVVNAKHSSLARMLAEKIAACFSIALNNNNHLKKTELAATTDSLTGALNRVAYKSDRDVYDNERPLNFSCIYVDVNELHLCNNKYGHAAGDEMLLYIANTLKDVFYGHRIYRMGGDEFLVFCQNSEQEDIKKSIGLFLDMLQPRNYHVAIGLSYRSQNTDTEEMVKEAEKRMYEAKAQYYQNKEQKILESSASRDYVQVKTGILEIDTMLSVLKEKYNGIYRVSLDTDKGRRILMPAYLNYNEDEEHFSELYSKYVDDSVEPDYRRALLSFMNYEAIKQQFAVGKTPKIKYKKINGEGVVLSIYKLSETEGSVSDTLWVFAKE